MAVTPNYSWPIPVATDYVKDGYDAIADLGNAIDTTVAGLASGLTLITTATLSASSGQIFSSLVAGKTYRIVGSVYGTGASVTLNCKFRETSTDKSANYYGANFYTSYSGGSGNVNPLNLGSQIILGNCGATAIETLSFSYDLNVQATHGRMYGTNYSSKVSQAYFGGYSNETMTTFNAINLYPSSGTITGKISLYEYE
jgi:hypothetical protein